MIFFFYPDSPELRFQSFNYFRTVRIEKQNRLFVFRKKLRLNNFVSRSTDLQNYPKCNFLGGLEQRCQEKNFIKQIFLNGVSRVSICTCFNVNAAFFYRNQTSLVNLQLLTNNKKVEQVVYGREYTLRADITHADGKILISSKAKKKV